MKFVEMLHRGKCGEKISGNLHLRLTVDVEFVMIIA
jgi:hypothetical protein